MVVTTVSIATAAPHPPVDRLYGNDGNDRLSGDDGNDTLYGGSGNDTFTGGKGNDVFVYEGGNDLISDFSTGKNTVKLGSGVKVTDHTLTSGGDMNFACNSGTLIMSATKNVEVTIGSSIYYNSFAYDSKKTALTLSGGYSGTLTSGEYSSKTKVVNASRVGGGVYLNGNAQANAVTGGAGNDTLTGGAGNDTLTGGAGRDVFIYTAGKDVITDFTAGTDVLQVSGRVSSWALKSGSEVFNIDAGTLTLRNTKDAEITLNGAIYCNNLAYNESKSAVTLGTALTGTLKSSDYSESVRTIDGSAITKKLRINGNDASNSIKGGAGNNTLAGGSGNDTLTGGAGKDVFLYTAGNDVITDYTAGEDTLRVDSGSITSYAFEGNDVIFNLSTGGTVTVKDGNGKSITTTVNRKTTTQEYTSRSANALWFTADDTSFVNDSAQLSDITGAEFSVTEIELADFTADSSTFLAGAAILPKSKDML